MLQCCTFKDNLEISGNFKIVIFKSLEKSENLGFFKMIINSSCYDLEMALCGDLGALILLIKKFVI